MPVIAITSVNTTTEEITAVAHGLTTGDRFRLRNVGGALPAATPSLAGATDYFAVRTGADTLKISDTNAHALAGTGIVNLTGSGSGTTTVEYGLPYCNPTVLAAAGTQIKSANDREAWSALVALYQMLVGQTQAIWSAITLNLPLTVTGTFIHTAAEFLPIGPAAAAIITNIVYDGAGDRLLKINDTAPIQLVYPILLPRGRRVIGVRVHVLHTSATAGLWTAQLQSSDMSNTVTTRSSVGSSTATTAIQVIVPTSITPTPIGADESWSVFVASPGGPLCDRYSFGVEIQHDALP